MMITWFVLSLLIILLSQSAKRNTNTITIYPMDEDKISDAVDEFKDALEKMGVTNVVLIYAYTDPAKKEGNKNYHVAGESSDNYLLTIGVCEQVKYNALKDSNNYIPDDVDK